MNPHDRLREELERMRQENVRKLRALEEQERVARMVVICLAVAGVLLALSRWLS